MIDLPPPLSGSYDPATYFAWPIYAKDALTLTLSDAQIANLTAAQSAAEGMGSSGPSTGRSGSGPRPSRCSPA